MAFVNQENDLSISVSLWITSANITSVWVTDGQNRKNLIGTSYTHTHTDTYRYTHSHSHTEVETETERNREGGFLEQIGNRDFSLKSSYLGNREFKNLPQSTDITRYYEQPREIRQAG